MNGQTKKTIKISIHALREEGDVSLACAVSLFTDFYPRPPRGGRLHAPFSASASNKISIHALREEGDLRSGAQLIYQPISIHALREEGDSKNRDKISIFKQIIQHSARI